MSLSYTNLRSKIKNHQKFKKRNREKQKIHTENEQRNKISKKNQAENNLYAFVLHGLQKNVQRIELESAIPNSTSMISHNLKQPVFLPRFWWERRSSDVIQ